MAVPPPPPPPPVVPAINKTYTDIKFFIKNVDTTKAFTEIPFTGSGNGYENTSVEPSVEVSYPNEAFDNTNTGDYPFINLDYLSDNFELKAPISLGTGSVTGDTVLGDSAIFTDIETNTYLLYRDADETYAGDADSLKVLGYVLSKTDDTTVVLSADVPAEIEPLTLELFSWEGTDNDENLYTLNFNFQDNFYMVVKNADYTTGNHDAVLLIDTTRTSSDYTTYPQPFAYSPSKIINPEYFKLERISKVFKPLVEEEVTNIVTCSIKGVSKWSEKELFQDLVSTIPLDEIPYWSVYEINPQSDSIYHLDRNTFYRLTVKDSLPSSRVYVTPIEA